MTVCPREFVDAETSQVLLLADLFKKGIPPVAGGSLDQTQAFLDAARFAWAEDEYWKAQKR